MEDGDDDTPVKVNAKKGEAGKPEKDEDPEASGNEEVKELVSENEDFAIVCRDEDGEHSLHEESRSEASNEQRGAESSDLASDPVEEEALPECVDDEIHQSFEEPATDVPSEEREEPFSPGEDEPGISKDDSEDHMQPSSEGQEEDQVYSGEEGHLLSSIEDPENMHTSMDEEEEEKQNSACHENEPLSDDGEQFCNDATGENANESNFQEENDEEEEYYSNSQEGKETSLKERVCSSPDSEAQKSELATSKEERSSEVDLEEEPSSNMYYGEGKGSDVSKDDDERETDFMSEKMAVSPVPSMHDSSPPGSPLSSDTKDTSDVELNDVDMKDEELPNQEEKTASPCNQSKLSTDEYDEIPPKEGDNALNSTHEDESFEMKEEDSTVPSDHENDMQDKPVEDEPRLQDGVIYRKHENHSDVSKGENLDGENPAPLEEKPVEELKEQMLSPSGDEREEEDGREMEGEEEDGRKMEEEEEDGRKMEEEEEDIRKTEEDDVKEQETSHVEESTTARNDEPLSPREQGTEPIPSEECEKQFTRENDSDVYHNSEGNKINIPVETTDHDTSKKVNGEVELEKDALLHETVPEMTSAGKDKYGIKRKLQSSPQEASSDNSSAESVKGNVHFKGFKKRYIAQVSEEMAGDSPEVVSYNPPEESNMMEPVRKMIIEHPQVLVTHQPLPDGAQSNTPLTEYAQYLGLQPTVKFKCYKCGESGFPSMLRLQEHQNTCLKNLRIQTYNKPQPSPTVEPVPSTNFRITRKVYLCSACGTYYENWNLFLHMLEVHKRYICLFCLGMFSQADKLALHLSAKHGVTDSSYNSPEEFLNEFKGSFFVMCCTCEQMFTERDHFFDHLCSNTVPVNTDQACSLCGLKGAHFPTCRRAFTDNTSLASSQSVATNANSESTQNSQLNVQEKTVSVTKYLMPTDKATTGRKGAQKSGQNSGAGKNQNMADSEDVYDISDAASYCHVNIHEPDKQKASNKGKTPLKYKGIDSQETDSVKSLSSSIAKPNGDTDVSGRIVEDVQMNNLADQSEKEESTSQEKHKTQVLQQETTSKTADNEDTQITNTTHKQVENQKINSLDAEEKSPETKPSPKQYAESDSETSDSGADSHDSDGSSSSSEGSSEENEPNEKKPQGVEKSGVSEDSDGDKSDSDKMSIVVDEMKSEDETEQPLNANDNKSINNSFNETQNLDESKDICQSEGDQNVESKLAKNNGDLLEEQHSDNIQIAGDDVPLLELTFEETLDVLSIQTVVKECVKVSCSSCVYCNHAKKIAVNGKQLVLHLLAEHRFEPIVCSDSGELIPVDGFVDKLKSKLSEFQDMFFNTDTYDSADKTLTKSYDRTYECFHCHFITTLHKELYVHNRKMHQKTILLCIMCKSNFYSYSELLCHLCPGIYVPDSNILFRCCLCTVDGLPSAFRLMVHLRKRHHACDVCLETTGDQQKLSNHVWKHKLHHLCYRCGIAYRNKPDITKHLFWKHGTESVLCKKCLQKKWPHVYHFCIPPTAFLCEECNASFSRAVALKVHKRLHVGDSPYDCDECEEKFISKRLLRRHKEKHKQALNVKVEQTLEDKDEEKIDNPGDEEDNDVHSEPKDGMALKEEAKDFQGASVKNNSEIAQSEGDLPKNLDVSIGTLAEKPSTGETVKSTDPNIKNEKKSKVVDVYDLPPLNLSSESDDSEEESTNKPPVNNSKPSDVDSSLPKISTENITESEKPSEAEIQNEEEPQPIQIVDGVWDNFKNYKANLEKRESLQAQVSGTLKTSTSILPSCSTDSNAMVDIVMADHDYCVVPTKPPEENLQPIDSSAALQPAAQEPLKNDPPDADDDKNTFGADHNYCYNTSPHQGEEKKEEAEQPEPVLPIVELPVPQTPPLANSTLPAPTISTPTKKKQKSPKKKQKQSGSSSSSDSSSNSDSSSCTCGTNCSCTSSSSSSSGSSSSSSDSDSSSSEGRRRQAARRERRKERAKKKLEAVSKGGTPPPAAGDSALPDSEGGAYHQAANLTQPEAGAGPLLVEDTPAMRQEPEETELLIRESDLDTTETETDEDFYDKYPQKQANKLLTEKRNQLLLLAAVAPVNNGTMAQPNPTSAPATPEPVQKKKGKTKRHKKGQHNSSEKRVENKLKLNIPASYYHSPSYSNTTHPISPVPNPSNPVPIIPTHMSRVSHDTYSSANPEAISTPSAYHSTGSGSETESKRLSKRKRIPKRFYGDSSDEEAEHTPQPPYKWRKVGASSSSTPTGQTPAAPTSFNYRASAVIPPPPEPVRVQPLPQQEKTDDEDGDDSDSDHETKRSSSDSSNSDSDNDPSDVDSDVETAPTLPNAMSAVGGNTTQQKNENLYCYCQCPYDEVSEMIACDGKDCSIEWFHFECVGIMVPPKGKWFCPDCRKKTAVRSEYLLHA